MFGIVLWLVFAVISYVILFVLVKSAIDNSSLQNVIHDLNMLRNQKNREIETLNSQLEEMKQLLREQNELIRRQINDKL